jgi:hypothetical protein
MKNFHISALVFLALQLTMSYCELDRGLTSHFINWLDTNGYKNYNFERDDFELKDGSYGGKETDGEIIERQPVIFLTGASDHGVGINEETS